MIDQKTLPVMHCKRRDFEVVCINCDTLGIVFDCAEGAPSSTEIKCRHCGGLRGTLGDLRTFLLQTDRICSNSKNGAASATNVENEDGRIRRNAATLVSSAIITSDDRTALGLVRPGSYGQR